MTAARAGRNRSGENVPLASGRGRVVLALLCAVAFLDFTDASIVNVALPAMRAGLHFSEAGLQWVPGGYLLTYGGLMLAGGRAADLLGRRRVLVAGHGGSSAWPRWPAGWRRPRACWSAPGSRRARARR